MVNLYRYDGEIPEDIAEEFELSRTMVPDESLIAALGFTLDDLDANRAGKMTERQQGTVKYIQKSSAVWPVLAACWVLAQAMGAIHTDLWSALFCCSSIIWIPLGLFEAGRKYEIQLDGSAGIVSVARGQVFPYELDNSKIVVNRQVLELPKGNNSIFVPGEHYAIYHAPQTRVVLSAEGIEYE